MIASATNVQCIRKKQSALDSPIFRSLINGLIRKSWLIHDSALIIQLGDNVVINITLTTDAFYVHHLRICDLICAYCIYQIIQKLQLCVGFVVAALDSLIDWIRLLSISNYVA